MKMITSEEARDLLLAQPVFCRKGKVPLLSSIGRVSAKEVWAETAVPPFARSPYDGYALRGEDTESASQEHPVVLRIIEEIPAGTAPPCPVGPGQAAKILTGGPIPEGANATVKYEDTEFTEHEVSIFSPCVVGSNVAPAGEDVSPGAVLARKGEVLSPAVIGLMAGQGFQEAEVFDRPTVSVISTGSELLEPGEPWQPGKIYNSNTYTICSLLQAAGVEAVPGGVVLDDLDAIAGSLTESLAESDMVITTGGASVGDYDWAERAAKAIGSEILFWKFAMKPGGSCLGAVKNGKVLLGLSGNPGAAVLALEKVGMPFVRKLCGRRDILPDTFQAVLTRDYPKKSSMPRMLRGHLTFQEGQVFFEPQEGEGNGVLSSLAGCDALGELPAGSPPVPAGTKIHVFRI